MSGTEKAPIETPGTDVVPDHGVPPGAAQEEAKGTPNSERHRTEHAVLTDEELGHPGSSTSDEATGFRPP